MKRKILYCDNCKSGTIHSLTKRFTSAGRNAGKLKREVDRCDKCQRTIIKNRDRTYVK